MLRFFGVRGAGFHYPLIFRLEVTLVFVTNGREAQQSWIVMHLPPLYCSLVTHKLTIVHSRDTDCHLNRSRSVQFTTTDSSLSLVLILAVFYNKSRFLGWLAFVVDTHFQTVLLSVMTLITDPRPATSTTFSCQLNNTLMEPPSPPPRPRPWICENPVACGVTALFELGVVCAMPLYLPLPSVLRSKECNMLNKHVFHQHV